MNRLILLLILGVIYDCARSQSILFLDGILRDQAPKEMRDCAAVLSHKGSAGLANGGLGFSDTDFQMPIGSYTDNEKGLVGKECNAQNGWFPPACGEIGVDRTPVYAYTGMSPGKSVHSPASFYRWFHDSEQTFNQALSLPLRRQSIGNIYSYSNSSFFPLDNLGWRDYCGDAALKKNHNYGFCFESHTRFGYSGGEELSVTSDGDVWVYIDNRLVIDLGGLHKVLSRQVQLDNIPGLVKSNSYKIDIFYCERHTSESVFSIRTSVVPFCAYYDWCGVCEGSGESC